MREKLLALKPEDEETAQQLQLLVAFSPAIMGVMPSEPAELDRMLEVLAAGAVMCRSDDAPQLAVHRWNEEEGKWEELE